MAKFTKGEVIPDPDGVSLRRMTPRALFKEVAPGSMAESADGKQPESDAVVLAQAIRSKITNVGALDVPLNGMLTLTLRVKIEAALSGDTDGVYGRKVVSLINSLMVGDVKSKPADRMAV
ncbi:hypothetical protein HZA42_02840 [Candidatus Peregrinibacteria bacterium]|nr:hypothetical protein [Candidatus Peregrinibacteria bacterium]